VFVQCDIHSFDGTGCWTNVTDGRADLIKEGVEKAVEQMLRAGQVIHRLREFVTRGETERRIESVEETSVLALVAAREQSVQVSMALDPTVDLGSSTRFKYSRSC
jgi:phosphoglycerate-specific signal transduction histidine kinase